ncbi:MAG: hypothetical protein F6K26_00485 [Moorea sp. SIO2I5]|nr:hypothetical protein [Moorena sp. SIO2I5]
MSHFSTVTNIAFFNFVSYKVSGFREQGTGNREQGTGNREQGTGNREQGKNPVYLIVIKNALNFTFYL